MSNAQLTRPRTLANFVTRIREPPQQTFSRSDPRRALILRDRLRSRRMGKQIGENIYAGVDSMRKAVAEPGLEEPLCDRD
jgi:hypothetical protein